MRKSLPFLLVAVGALVASACDAGSSSSDEPVTGAAGAPAGGAGAHAGSSGAPAGGAHAGGAQGAAGGSAGAHTGGAGGAGTAGGSGLILGAGGPFPFPQAKKPASCSLTTAAGASAAVQSAYNSWKAAMVTSNGAGAGGLRVQRNTNGNDTVSEGIGYGMIAAAYLNDKPTFDGLWTYAQAQFDASGLMNWHIDASGNLSGSDKGSATDADEDMAWALLMASNQWSSAAYLTAAKTMITAISTNSIGDDGTLKPGDSWGETTTTFPDYFAPSYYRVFAKVTNNPAWSGVIIDRNYTVLAAVSGTHGLVPDKITSTSDLSGNYLYDACRTPWRIGMDYCFNAEPRAKAYLDKIGPFFNGVGASNIVDGYSPSGSGSGNVHNMAFIGPAGVAGMAGYPTLLDGAFSFGASNGGGDTSYYGQSLRVLTMLMMSGNFVDFTKP
ncbi:MAG: glycosyl hydrolase family 8 [Polyangiaceae bacterium]